MLAPVRADFDLKKLIKHLGWHKSTKFSGTRRMTQTTSPFQHLYRLFEETLQLAGNSFHLVVEMDTWDHPNHVPL